MRVRPWQLAMLSVMGGAVGALIVAVVMPARLESQMDVGIPSFAGLACRTRACAASLASTRSH